MLTPDMQRLLDLTGRVVLVTGGAGDIGSAAAGHAARLGATVVVADNGTSVSGAGEDPKAAARAAEQFTGEVGTVTGHYCDVTDPDQVQDLFDTVVADHGGVDAVIAAAGVLRVRPIWETTLDDWRSMMDSHATHTYLVAAEACRRWRADAVVPTGRSYRSSRALVTFTAATGLVGRPDLGVTHSAAKGAIAGMTLELAHEMFPYDVTVNAVSAANVRGRMAEHVGAAGHGDPTDITAEGEFDPHSAEHAGVLTAYLASGDADFVTGQVFRVVGGLIGRYQPWHVAESLEQQKPWSMDDLRLGVRRLFGAYPEYKAIQGAHREF